MNIAELRAAYDDFLAVAEEGGFGPPPPGEWDAEHLLAHIYAGHAHITSLALQVVGGLRPAYDNRASLDEWNLRRVIDSAGGDRGRLIELVRQGGELHCAVAEHLTGEHLAVPVHVLIISNDELVVDDAWSLGQLVFGVGMVHLPRHADQLRSLVPAAV